ncbi:HNH endonuclease [Streptomyces sp. NPDC058758]|uniref:HNH endonuclease n=1 Tax=Streptomyces sp. NPDC058758 TaxID=3346627 RepID=UPI0036B8D219
MTRPIRTTRVLSSRQRRAKKSALYSRQKSRCATCNERHAFTDLILKHKLHRTQGGDSTLANLYLICHPCNHNGHRAVTP